MFYNLKDGDNIEIVRFLDERVIFFINDKHAKIGFTYCYDDKNSSIQKFLNEIWFDEKRKNNDIDFSIFRKFYALAIIDEEYHIIKYGRTLQKLFISNLGKSPVSAKIRITIKHGFSCYENSYLIDSKTENIDSRKVEKLIITFNEYLNSMYWYNTRYFQDIYDIFIKYNKEDNPILQKHLRKFKLQRLIND